METLIAEFRYGLRDSSVKNHRHLSSPSIHSAVVLSQLCLGTRCPNVEVASYGLGIEGVFRQ